MRGTDFELVECWDRLTKVVTANWLCSRNHTCISGHETTESCGIGEQADSDLQTPVRPWSQHQHQKLLRNTRAITGMPVNKFLSKVTAYFWKKAIASHPSFAPFLQIHRGNHTFKLLFLPRTNKNFSFRSYRRFCIKLISWNDTMIFPSILWRKFSSCSLTTVWTSHHPLRTEIHSQIKSTRPVTSQKS